MAAQQKKQRFACISADHARYDMFLRLLSEYERDGQRVLWHDQRHGRLMAVSSLDGRLYPIQGERFRALANTVLRACVPLPPGADEWKILSIPESAGAYRAVMAGLREGMLPGLKVCDPQLASGGVPRGRPVPPPHRVEQQAVARRA